jgi:hypothetical protein
MKNLCKLTLLLLLLTPTGVLAFQRQVDGAGSSSPPPAEHRLVADQPKAEEACICMEVYLPVCATLPNGERKTFSNACFAKCAKAKTIHEGPC